MSEKSYIGMSICFICLEPKEILLHKSLSKVFDAKVIANMEPCDKCKEHMKKGVILVSSPDGKRFNGTYAVVKDKVIGEVFSEDRTKKIIEQRVVILETELYDKIVPNDGDKNPKETKKRGRKKNDTK